MKEIIVKLITLSNLDQLQKWQLEFEIRKLYTGRVADIGYDSLIPLYMYKNIHSLYFK